MKPVKNKGAGAETAELPLDNTAPAPPPVEGDQTETSETVETEEAPAPESPAPVEDAPAPGPTEAVAVPARASRAKVRDLPRLMTRIFGTPLLMSAAKIEVILSAMGPRLGLATCSIDPKAFGAFFDDGDDEDGDETDDLPYDLTDDGVAIIGVDGTLVYKSSWLGALSGMTGYGDLRCSLDAALADPQVRGILLTVDSNGGEVNGCFDLSDAVYAGRAVKPIYGVAADDSYSAAYALLSACSKVFASRTSGLGSIGVVALHIDQSAADKQEGLKFTYVHAGEHKVDGNPHEPLSAGAEATIQKECDRLWSLFAGSVAKYRSLSVDSVLAMQAACYYGEEAVAAKLADAVGTPQDALAALRADIASRNAAVPASPITSLFAEAPVVEIVADSPAPTIEAAAPVVIPDPKAPTSDVIDLAAERLRVRGETSSNAVEIIELCKLAGQPDKAAELIRNHTSVEDARILLQTLRANTSDARTITGHITAEAGGNDSQMAAASWQRAFAAARGHKEN